jgi:hypothetical protein
MILASQPNSSGHFMTIDIFNDFATNSDSEVAGVWVPYAGDVEFLIARAGNKVYARNFLKLYQASRRVIEAKGPTAEAKAEEINIETAAKGILLGWKGDLQFKGQPLPYSFENAKLLLGVADFRNWVREQSEDMAKYKVVKDEEDSGN